VFETTYPGTVDKKNKHVKIGLVYLVSTKSFLTIPTMNSLATLAMIYALITAGSAGILYFSFKACIDYSGRYFLLAESAMLLSLLAIILSNAGVVYQTPMVLFVSNFFMLSSEVSIAFSLYSLTRTIKINAYSWAILGVAAYAGLIEISRDEAYTRFPVALMGFSSMALAFLTWRICKLIQSSQTEDNTLGSNQFLDWITKIEIGLGLFAAFRLFGAFLATPMNPHNPTPMATLLYALFVVMNVFRYIAYQSLRISWVDPRTNQTNPLNKKLASTFEEKDYLLRSLISSNRVIGVSALASSLAHQLSQPLTAIGLQTETLKRDLVKTGNHEKMVVALDKVTMQLSKLSGLVKNLRQLFDKQSYKLNEVELSAITNEVLELIEPTLKSNKIRLNKTFNSNPVILGDAIQIQQVLINIFNNAVDAIIIANSKSKEIKLTIASDKRFAIISVEDTGAGIDTNDLPAIFNLYKTTKAKGLGVGLWLTKTIIDKHHGKVSASNNTNGGAIFTVQIPLANKDSNKP